MKIKQLLQASDIRWIWKPVIALALALCMGAFIGIGQAHASCIALDDVPLDVQEQQAPGIVMFVLDDSGSMDWEYIVQGEYNALFYVGGTSYFYIFDNPGDNVYGTTRILEGSTHANQWKARWAGYNRLYYHPGDLYVPWPAMSDADPNNPRSNPAVAGNTLNLNAVYSDFGGITDADINAVGGTIVDNSDVAASSTVTTAQILAAGGTIVDNSDVAAASSDIIVDDRDAGYQETGSWGTSGAGGYWGDRSRYTNNTGAYATWTPDLPDAGVYKVYIWYTSVGDRDENARYTVSHAGGDTDFRRNQKVNAGQWVELGDFTFNAGTAGYIRVTRDGASTGNATAADAVRLVPQFAVTPPDAVFESSTGWSQSTAGGYNGNYLYTSGGGRTYTATWTANNLDTGQTYDVYARWYGGGTSRSTNVRYYTTHNGGTTDTGVNQQGDYDTWTKIAEGVSFSSGTGRVDINQYAGNSGLCADAVAFMPASGGLPDVVFEAGPGWSSASDGNQYGVDYLYSDGGNMTYTAAWIANNLDTAINFDVYARWAGGGTNRLTDVRYYTTHDGGTTDTGVNQQENYGVWTKIADNVSFSTGIGRVEINQNAGTSGLCADAVAFVPHGSVAPIAIGRAHYFVQTAGGTFLVNLYGGVFEYFRLNDNNNNDAVDSGELVRLTGAEATSAGIVTGRTYAEERQNFANWYSFYRKRELTAKNAVGKVIDEMEGVYIGISCINAGLRTIARPVRVDLNDVIYDQSATLLTTLYAINSSGGTPLRNGLHSAGQYFRGTNASSHLSSATPSGYFNTSTYPYFLAEYGGSCQQAFTILMTDGFWNGIHSTAQNADANTSNEFDGPPFADTYSNTLADVAMYHYKNDLNTNLNDDVPINNVDKATHQHMVTYSLSFGMTGTLNRADYPDCPTGDCPAWPQPSAGAQTTIDDLWHASVNGRGRYVDASSPMEMVNAMNELKQDIQSRLGSSASLATSSIQRTVGTTIYQGTYNTAGWHGEVTAYSVNLDTGAVGAPKWNPPGASSHVPTNHNERNIISFDGTSTINFQYDSLTTAQQSLLANNGHNVSHLVDYLRGDTSRNQANGGPFRVRSNPIGDIVHSAPTYHKGVVYIGANDGMLHAINGSNGHEIFCYVPNMVYGHLSELALPGYSHKYYVDSTPTIGRVGSADILVCGLGKGGKGYFGLDVTSTSNPSALWEYTNDDDLGYSFSEAKIVPTDAGKMVVFGNGYDSVNENAVLFIVNPATGALVRKLDTQVGGCNGLATPTVVDVNGDGNADFVFAGDLKGNMWKFDIRGDAADWKVYYGGTAPQPLISMRNADGDIQPITTAPEVMLDCAKSDFAYTGKGLMVIFGTGRYLNSDDFGDFTTQSFYGIWDWGDIWETREDYDTAKTKFLGEVASGRSLSNVSGTSLQEQTVESTSGDWLTLSSNPVEWYNPIAATGEHMGWVFDLPVTGERGIREPMLRMGVAILTSIIPSSSPCDAGGSSVVYMVNACTGGRTYDPQFDVDGDGYIDEDDLIDGLPPTGQEFDEILYPPIEIGASDLYFSDASGGITPLQVPPNLMGMQFWRFIQ
jgi:type IV pilus assembly protein PilY1